MGETSMLDKTFHCIMRRMVETGRAPFYTEIAAELDVSVEEGRKALHDLFSEMIPGWLYPNTDRVTSPFQQPAHPVTHHDRRPAELVCPMRL